MAILTLDRVTIEPIEIEIPDSCLSCGQEFDQPESLAEYGFIASRRTCQMVTRNDVQIAGEHETTEVIDELALVTAYRCGGCNALLAGSPLPEVSSD